MILKLNIFYLIFIINLLILQILSNPLTNNNSSNSNENNISLNSNLIINNKTDSVLLKYENGKVIVSQPDLNELLSNYHKVRRQKTRDDIRNYATIGLITGTLQVEERMKNNLRNMSHEFYTKFNSSTPDENWEKLYEMERTMERDKRAVQILGTTMDFARNSKTFKEYKNDIKQISKANEIASVQLAKRKFNIHNRNIKRENTNKTLMIDPAGNPIINIDRNPYVNQLHRQARGFRSFVETHISKMHQMISIKTGRAIDYLKKEKGLNVNDFNVFSFLSTPHSNSPSFIQMNNNNNNNNNKKNNNINNINSNTIASTKPRIVIHFEDELKAENFNSVGKSINDIRIQIHNDANEELEGSGGDESNFIERAKRQDKIPLPKVISNTTQQGVRNQKQEEGESFESGSGSDEAAPPGGGIVALIASLSGGDGGSDVGALLGSLTGVVSNLFGPGGLDVPSLIGTGTSLISGLLGGDQNFGKVLGGYIGTAVDGLSGGGGAINNGQFFGQFLGTMLAQLSADPEDDEQPPQPLTFLSNIISGLKTGKNKAAPTDAEGADAGADGGGGKSGDILGYISNLVTSIVGGIANAVLNASLGLAGGASQGLAGFSSGSVEGKHGHSE